MKTMKWIGIFLGLVVTGCATSRITTWWKADNIVPKDYHKILVLGLIRTSDRTMQQNMENHMVDDLRNLGYDAVSSLQEYGPKAFDKMDEEAALKKLHSSGVDAVITIVLLDKQKEKNYEVRSIRFVGKYQQAISRKIDRCGQRSYHHQQQC